MKRKFVRAALAQDNRFQVESLASIKELPEYALALLRLIAEVLDDVASGEDAWLTVGSDTGKTAFLLTYHYGSDRISAGGGSIKELGEDSSRLCEPL